MPAAPTRVYATFAVGVLGICISSILFFTILDEPSQAQLSGFYSLVFSIILSTVLIALVERQKSHLAGAFGKIGVYSLVVIYFCATALVAIVFMAGIFGGTKWLYAVHGVCLCLLAIFFVALLTASKNMTRGGANIQATMENFKQLESRLGIIRMQNPGAPWAGRVAQCQEEIRFFDYSCVVPADTLLLGSIDKLELELVQKAFPDSELESTIHSLLEDIFALAQQRNMEAQNKLKGQF